MICNIIDGPIRVVIRNFCGKSFTSCTAHISPIVLIILWYTVRKIILRWLIYVDVVTYNACSGRPNA